MKLIALEADLKNKLSYKTQFSIDNFHICE